jgi:histidinol dehydrogenase
MEIIEYNRNPGYISKIINRGLSPDKTIVKTVKNIVREVRERGDRALFSYTKRYDGYHLEASTVAVTEKYLLECKEKADPEFLALISEAKANIERYHLLQKQSSWLEQFPDGVRLGQRIIPLERVGVYVPGGKAFYPSTVLMNIIPAQIAGVEQIIVVTPPAHFFQKPLLGATLALLGI